MIKSDHLMQLDQVDLYNNEEHYILVYNDKYFYTNNLLFETIKLLKDKKFISEEFKKEHELNDEEFTEIFILINEKLASIFKERKPKRYVNLKVTLLDAALVNMISTSLLFLFTKVKYILPLVIILNLVLVYELINKSAVNFTSGYIDSIVIYLSLFFILLFHELGHSTALKKFNIEPQEVGFGFYLVFPVLFSNVTRAWLLRKRQRIVINLSGIYFQLVASSFLVIFYFLLGTNTVESIIISITKANFFVLVYSLFPFIRNDGYWALSDSLNIPDLHKRSVSYPIDLVKNKVSFNLFLALYSIGQYTFLGFIIFKYVPSIPNNYSSFYFTLIDDGLINLILSKPSILFHFVLSSVILYSISKSLLAFLKK